MSSTEGDRDCAVCGESARIDMAFCPRGHLFPTAPTQPADRSSAPGNLPVDDAYLGPVAKLRANDVLMWGMVLAAYQATPHLFVLILGMLPASTDTSSPFVQVAAYATFGAVTVLAGIATKRWGFALLTGGLWHVLQWYWLMLPGYEWASVPWLKPMLDVSWVLPALLILVGVITRPARHR
jgi:hypothetical protein